MDTAIAVGLVMAAAATALTYALARRLRPARGCRGGHARGHGSVDGAFGGDPHSASASMAVVAARRSWGAATPGAGTARTLRSPGWPAGAALLLPRVRLPSPWGRRARRAHPAGRGGWYRRRALADAGLSLVSGVAAVAYGMILTKVSLDSLIHENLFPRDQLEAGGDAVLRGSAPMVQLPPSSRTARRLYGGAAALLALAHFVRRGSRAAKFAAGQRAPPGADCSRCARSSCAATWTSPTPGFLPGRPRRAGPRLARPAQPGLGRPRIRSPCCAPRSSRCCPPRPTRPSSLSLRVCPVRELRAAVRRHLPRRPHGELGDRTAASVGLALVAVLAVAGWVLVAHDARDESFTSGPGGSMTAPLGPGLPGGDLDPSWPESGPGDPILLAPGMSALYTLTERTDPEHDISLLPGMAGDGDNVERQAIAAMEPACASPSPTAGRSPSTGAEPSGPTSTGVSARGCGSPRDNSPGAMDGSPTRMAKEHTMGFALTHRHNRRRRVRRCEPSQRLLARSSRRRRGGDMSAVLAQRRAVPGDPEVPDARKLRT